MSAGWKSLLAGVLGRFAAPSVTPPSPGTEGIDATIIRNLLPTSSGQVSPMVYDRRLLSVQYSQRDIRPTSSGQTVYVRYM